MIGTMRSFPLLAAVLMAAAPAAAVPARAVHVSGWARATVPAQSGSAAYLLIHNAELTGDRLLSVSTPAAAGARLHQSATTGGVVRMRPVSSVPIGPDATVEMKPGGLHVMLSGLRGALQPGRLVPLTLRFERAGAVQVKIPIRAQARNAGHRH